VRRLRRRLVDATIDFRRILREFVDPFYNPR